MSVYILGAGAMGSLVAHELARGALLAPTLLLRTPARLEAYQNAGLAISVVRPSGGDFSATRVPLPAQCRPPLDSSGRPQHIDHLVVATKAHAVTAALKPYVNHLLDTSTVMFVQNGMGVAEEAQDELWSTRSNVPTFYQAISTHGAFKMTPTEVHHVGFGGLTLSQIPPRHPSPQSPTDEAASGAGSPLVKALLALGLNASYILHQQFLLRQMEKLVANACINPLTAVLDCFNGDLLLAPKTLPLMKRVVRECVDCFRAEHPELMQIADAPAFLDKDRLLALVIDLCQATAQNSSSMREDLRHLHRTEIDWINGYIVRLGYTHRIPTPTNRMLMELVQSKLSLERAKENLALQRATK